MKEHEQMRRTVICTAYTSSQAWIGAELLLTPACKIWNVKEAEMCHEYLADCEAQEKSSRSFGAPATEEAQVRGAIQMAGE